MRSIVDVVACVFVGVLLGGVLGGPTTKDFNHACLHHHGVAQVQSTRLLSKPPNIAVCRDGYVAPVR